MDILHSYKDNCGFGLLANIKNIASHDNLKDALSALEKMMHRGAIAADGKSGDGSGLLFSMPTKFLKAKAHELGVDLPEQFGIGMFFLNQNSNYDEIDEVFLNNDLKVILKREVPIDTKCIGEQALKTLPKIVQYFVIADSLLATKRFESLLYLSKKDLFRKYNEDEDFYISSLSSKSIVYKGLIMPTFIKDFYLDLKNENFEISFALFHQRFSTNTLPRWSLAQPFHSLAHNGEINSISANRFGVYSKTPALKSKVFSENELKRLLPITKDSLSDSGSLDNYFEFLIANGYDFFKAIRCIIPAPWQNSPHMDSDLRAFYEYSSGNFDPWDGPAAISFTNGRYIACVLDRNGLRPAKYIITKDDRLVIASEYGVVDINEDNILEQGRLQSGQMIGVDLKYAKIIDNNQINDYIKKTKPYNEWVSKKLKYLEEYIDVAFLETKDYELEHLIEFQRYANITQEVKDLIIKPMAKDAKEGVGSMGDDTPLACFSTQNRNFSHFFRQKFAQVTNPPIDPIREKIVMSLNIGFGEQRNILEENEEHANRLKSVSPILMQEKYDLLCNFSMPNKPRFDKNYLSKHFDTTFKHDLKLSLNKLALNIAKAIREENIRIIFLDDRKINKTCFIMPINLVVGRINQVLLEQNLRHLVTIIAITCEVYDSHSSASLFAFGANAIYPYLLYATVYDEYKNLSTYHLKEKLKNTHIAITNGLLKIMSKMGISTIASYRHSKLFDIIGLDKEILNDCFFGANLLLPGLSYEDIFQRIKKNHEDGFDDYSKTKLIPLELGGFYKFLFEKEYHDYNPSLIDAIHKASKTNNQNDYENIKNLIKARKFKMPRDFLEIKSDKKPISIDEVESVESIFKRFNTAAMSLGSISKLAHEAMAVAMNELGGMSNSGEGGEEKIRLTSAKNSKIKQIASGRFGVTPEYLVSADEIQIKVAQGAKPGEGGQLPGHKVSSLIASLRYTLEGVTLISPPPHHDIYSIEDLAQLIFDLKQVNPKAIIAVKLVSTAGVGTIAAGVAKCYADKIVISGADGGTGAAPLSSIKFAGNPWELGLIEAHNALKVNDLRHKVHLQTDGGLKIGLDVIKAALLGAQSYAFGTIILVILGCKLLRICHLNRCSVGVATQNEELQKHFSGSVEAIKNYFHFLAHDIREILASMGYASLNEIIGRNDLLKVVDDEFARKFDFSSLVQKIDGKEICDNAKNEPYDKNEFEKDILKQVYRVIEDPKDKVEIFAKIKNTNRSFGALISGEIAKFYQNEGLPQKAIHIHLEGTAGQSLGAFLVNGVNIILNGSANDYVGKGMNGGSIVIKSTKEGEKFSSAGNTCLYGATGGEFFTTGSVGERFCVRNSGAVSVVLGAGDHACEYMTGGVVVILGSTGVNFGAGMTGGVAFIYDEKQDFIDKLNQELVVAQRIDTNYTDEERYFLKRLLMRYERKTKSKKANFILQNYRNALHNFWMVRPKDLTKTPLNPEDGD